MRAPGAGVRRHTTIAVTGVVIAATTLAAGSAGAWVSTPAHSASGQTVAGTARVIYTNPLDRTINRTTRIYPAGKITTLRQAAYLRNQADKQRSQHKASEARTSAARANAKTAAAGRPLYESRTPTKVSPGTTRVVYWSPSSSPASSYSALTDCRTRNQVDTTAFPLRAIDV